MLRSPNAKLVETIKEKLHDTIAHLPAETPTCVLISEVLEDIVWDANAAPASHAAAVSLAHIQSVCDSERHCYSERYRLISSCLHHKVITLYFPTTGRQAVET